MHRNRYNISKYTRHQGHREMERRRKQVAKLKAKQE